MIGTEQSVFYLLLPSAFGQLGILWREVSEQAIVQRILLPRELRAAGEPVRAGFPAARRGSHRAIADLSGQLQAFLEGQAVGFALDSLAWEQCSDFQRRVLVAEHGIPRGSVSTYGLIAAHLAVERGARAVGTALARNPFPLIIPCHRAIRSTGELGGYQGGLDMKRRLLEMEGVPVSDAGVVVNPRFHYAATH